MTTTLRRLRNWLLVVVSLLLIACGTTILVLRSDWFREKVRARIMLEVEKASGGRAEIGAFLFNWKTLTAEVRGFVLHGTEPVGALPLFQADSIEAGLRILSVMERRIDLASLTVDHPQVHILVAADGTTNIPGPRTSGKSVIEEVLDLNIKKFALRGGQVIYNSDQFPLDVEGDGLSADMVYVAAGPRYKGTVNADRLRVGRPLAQPMDLTLETAFAFERNRVTVTRARVASAKSSVELSGEVDGLSSPHGKFAGQARLALGEIVRPLRLPIAGVGEASWAGTGSFASSPKSLNLDGRVSGKGIEYRMRGFDLKYAAFSSNLKLSLAGLELQGLTANALGGKFHGSLSLAAWRDLRVNGSVDSISSAALARSVNRNGIAWSGNLRGPVQMRGRVEKSGMRDVIAQGRLDIDPTSGGIPLSGSADMTYDQRAGELRFGESRLRAGVTQVDVSGTLGKTLQVQAVSANLDDVLPALPLVGVTPPQTLPVTLKSGTARVNATVTGPLNSPHIQGHVQASSFTFDGHAFDRIESDFDLDNSSLGFRGLTLARNTLEAKGSGRIGLEDWRVSDTAALSASINVRNANIKDLLAESGPKLPITGSLSADLNLSGTSGAPQADGTIYASHVTAWDETINRMQGGVHYQDGLIRVTGGSIEAGASRANISGLYRRSGADWTSGDVQFEIAAHAPQVSRLEAVRKLAMGVDGAVDLTATGTAHISKSRFELQSLNGQAALKNASLDGDAVGEMSLSAKTSSGLLRLEMHGKLWQSPFQGSGQWQLGGDQTGQAKIDFTPVSLTEAVAFIEHRDQPGQAALGQKQIERLNFSGTAAGSVTVSGRLDDLKSMKAEVRLTDVHLSGSPELETRAGVKPEDLVIHNSEPVIAELTSQAMTVRSAHFVARDTELSLAGRYPFQKGATGNLRLDGSINLAILRLFNKDLLASGHASVTATIRGALPNPEIAGRMELKQASLFLPDLPNGVDNANGVIVFDRSRATIQSLTAETGGGKVSFGGFVGFGQVLVYRLQATADQVRYRTPDGVSFTMNALLNLVGTSENSLVSGTVTVVRANVTPLTDVGGLLAQAAQPTPTPSAPSEYFRGMQFDIQIESAQSLEVRTSLARNLQAAIDLRVRGTLERPTLLGSLTVNQGEIEFFGTRYTIDHGEALFQNPLKIEPVIDLNLETRVRGIQVNLSLTGPLQKLNLSYRSDPPLESDQIIALLAVGRDPTSQGLASPTVTQSNPFSGSAGGLLATAITAPLSNRLERLFGGTRIKIDPEATDLTSIPQARLIFEQPISRNITLTYITNLNRTDQQIVRVQWDMSKNWSGVASREENGIFSLTFLYRKRFK